ncbi:MAG TPA: ATP-binding protein [Kiritimatiellia bacterium]|nr:ATP-binding protein [Kiritimatiellia bacterium]HMO97808.1 ATP-binding protein [Kiritimatiellia bacterium]HMP96400.1 ATP-binding protein [Kiritimatiellia bacterium]
MQLYIHMVNRTLWIEKIEKSWQERSILWLTGVRRVGKTTLARSLADCEYMDCELPRIRRQLEDPEGFLKSFGSGRLILDEVHRLDNPSEFLKIAADHFPGVRILATGSSTLGASQRFRDTLTGRKRDLHLFPVLLRELKTFEGISLPRRLQNGGLPENLMNPDFPEKDYAEWLDAFWARDVQELFRLERRDAFMRLLELLLTQSGCLCQLNSFTSACSASHTTLANYLNVLEATGVVHIVRPYAKNPQREIVAMPKVYGFDTGFVCFARGWLELRDGDHGVLWEHLVLDELLARFGRDAIFYWRDKQKHEVDFVLARRGLPPVAIECKWRMHDDAGKNFSSMRTLHPDLHGLVVAADVDRPRVNRANGWIETGLAGIEHGIAMLAG